MFWQQIDLIPQVRLLTISAAIGGVLILVGSFMTWYTLVPAPPPLASVQGIHYSHLSGHLGRANVGLGWFTVVFAALAVWVNNTDLILLVDQTWPACRDQSDNRRAERDGDDSCRRTDDTQPTPERSGQTLGRACG